MRTLPVMRASGMNMAQIARAIGASRGTVKDNLSGRRWSHVFAK